MNRHWISWLVTYAELLVLNVFIERHLLPSTTSSMVLSVKYSQQESLQMFFIITVKYKWSVIIIWRFITGLLWIMTKERRDVDFSLYLLGACRQSYIFMSVFMEMALNTCCRQHNFQSQDVFFVLFLSSSLPGNTFIVEWWVKNHLEWIVHVEAGAVEGPRHGTAMAPGCQI